MFTGIIEAAGVVEEVIWNGSNQTFWISSSISSSLKRDQSVAHDGVCLTVENTKADTHRVTAIHETLTKTTLGSWQKGDIINLERCLQMNGRLDGHIVQGHVDTTGTCVAIEDKEGSYEYRIRFPKNYSALMIEKGSVCVNGISLTVFDLQTDEFSIAIIPFTFNHTNINRLKPGNKVNLEFDFFGKYIHRLAETRGLFRTDRI